jgi:hypothetical protein
VKKSHLSVRDGQWRVLCDPFIYRTRSFAQACEVARRVIGPDKHLPRFMWLETRP